MPCHSGAAWHPGPIRLKEPAVFKGIEAQRLLALFAAGWLLFNFPLLGLWNFEITCWGVPLFPLALFGLWAVLIAATAWLAERPGRLPEDETS